MKKYIKQNGIIYELRGEQYYPLLELPDQKEIGKRGRNRFAGGGVGMKSIINELWHGNVCPQTDSRNNSSEMKELMKYMSRHHEDLEKSFSDEQKEEIIFENGTRISHSRSRRPTGQ